VKHRPEFTDLRVDVSLLLIESKDGSGDDFWSEFLS
jgi:hypothetical protein